MNITYHKKIDLTKMKKNLDKSSSIETFRNNALKSYKTEIINNCPICSNNNIKYISTVYNFEYFECINCKLAFVKNQPISEDIEKLYNESNYSSIANTIHFDIELQKYKVNNITKPKVKWFMEETNTQNLKWLDIGCGAGDLIIAAKEFGFDVCGIETNNAAKKFIKENYNIDVINEFINSENIDKFSGQTDVISLIGVLEHLKNPKEIILSISQLQKTGQYILIEVPHYPSLAAYSQMLHPNLVNRVMVPPYHLYMFSINSLKSLLTEYEITSSWYFGMDIYEYISTITTQNSTIENSDFIQTMYKFSNDFQKIIDENKLSDSILIIGRKK